ncbi:hypothetical protein Ait01nite_043270 [Actinoplanes italicus]|nr:hypothetical protein Ait01nite_043270 [Actinoplanes italicus]
MNALLPPFCPVPPVAPLSVLASSEPQAAVNSMAIETAKTAAARRGAVELITGTVGLLRRWMRERVKENGRTCAQGRTTLGVT